MTPDPLRRFVTLGLWAMVGAAVVGIAVTLLDGGDRPGELATRAGGQDLSAGRAEDALADFERALALNPDHPGARMGRAAALMALGRLEAAEPELSALIERLERAPEHAARPALLASAHANRGILHDRLGRHRAALDDYLRALAVDADAVSGPDLIDRILAAGPDAPTVAKRAAYLARQFGKPPDERVMRLPEIDAAVRPVTPR